MAIRSADRRPEGGRVATSRRVERRVYVKASPRVVWSTLHEAAAEPALMPELSLGPADTSWPAAGATRLADLRLGLLRTAVRLESLEARPDTAFRLIVTAAEFTLEWGWRLEPLAGGTRVVHDGAFEAHDRWASLLVRLGRESTGALADAHLRALKDAAERRWSGARGPAA